MSFVRRIVLAGAFGAAGASLALSSGASAAPLVAVVVQGGTVTVSTSDCAQNGAVAAIENGSAADNSQQDMAGNPEASGVLSATFTNVPPGTYTATVNCKNSSAPDPGTKQFTVTPNGNPDTGDGATARLGPRSTALAVAGLGVLAVSAAGGVVLVRRRTKAN